uniref:Uncharacterized protein n=1 Tax=Lepeophtheirus salmonis TaxID=72036 RepID=A0A0K2TSF2_LEPSM
MIYYTLKNTPLFVLIWITILYGSKFSF